MKDFIYVNDNKCNLHADACEWLRDIGLRETRWILDVDWIISNIQTTYNIWIKEK